MNSIVAVAMLVCLGCSSASMEPDAAISVDAGISDAAPVEEATDAISVPNGFLDSQSWALPDVGPLPPEPCVWGRWIAEFFVSGQSLANGWCNTYALPVVSTTEIYGNMWLLGCEAVLSSSDASACVYTNTRACLPTLVLSEGGSETFSWTGEVSFQEISKAFPRVVNGNVVWYYIRGMAGVTNIVIGSNSASPCVLDVVFTKQDGGSNAG